MKTPIITLIMALALFSCGGKDEKKKPEITVQPQVENSPTTENKEENEVPASQRITLDSKGVGQIKEIKLDPEIDQQMAESGAALFKTNCTACHRVDKRFIGPKMEGLLERRSPEWVMNMILDPQLMVEEDRCAMDLLVEFNGAAMANQNLTVDQTRSLLEFFRTLPKTNK